MNLAGFVAEREETWQELAALAARCRGRPERLGPAGVRRMGTLYRGAAADLAIARRKWPGDPIVRSLESLVARSRALVYDARGRRTSIRGFLGREYWRRIRERPGALWVSAALLFVPVTMATVWGVADPTSAAAYLPGNIRGSGLERIGDLGLSVGDQAGLSTLIFVNNIQVTFFAFALGLTLGLGTAYVLVANGLLLGVVTGLTISDGTAGTFASLVAPHGVLELSCIVVAGAAGLRLGWAIVSPGNRKRSTAVRAEARASVDLVLGTMPWLVTAGLIEGFFTPRNFDLPVALGVGFTFGALYWVLIWRRGKPEPESDTVESSFRPQDAAISVPASSL